MKILITLLFLITLVWGCAIPLIIRGYARMSADELISGNLWATEEQINTCIAALTWIDKWMSSRKESDSIRINLLRDRLKEMQKPHG
jgi:hypothetical protein